MPQHPARRHPPPREMEPRDLKGKKNLIEVARSFLPYRLPDLMENSRRFFFKPHVNVGVLEDRLEDGMEGRSGGYQARDLL